MESIDVGVRYSDAGLKQAVGTEAGVQLTFHLPLYMTVPYWIRHGLRASDVMAILAECPPNLLWPLALLFGLSPCGSALHVGYRASEPVVFGSKAIALRRIRGRLAQDPRFNQPHCRPGATLRGPGQPRAPHHPEPVARLRELRSGLPTADVRKNLWQTIVVPRTFWWRKIRVAALWEVDHPRGGIYCVRVVSATEFARPMTSIITRPLQISVAGQAWWGTEEVVVFHPRSQKTLAS